MIAPSPLNALDNGTPRNIILGVGKTKKPIASGNATTAATFGLSTYFGPYTIMFGSSGKTILVMLYYGGYSIVADPNSMAGNVTISVNAGNVSIKTKSGVDYPEFSVFRN